MHRAGISFLRRQRVPSVLSHLRDLDDALRQSRLLRPDTHRALEGPDSADRYNHTIASPGAGGCRCGKRLSVSGPTVEIRIGTWSIDHPLQWSTVIAVRSALRALPWAAENPLNALPIFRGASLARFAAIYPNSKSMKFVECALAAASTLDSSDHDFTLVEHNVRQAVGYAAQTGAAVSRRQSVLQHDQGMPTKKRPKDPEQSKGFLNAADVAGADRHGCGTRSRPWRRRGEAEMKMVVVVWSDRGNRRPPEVQDGVDRFRRIQRETTPSQGRKRSVRR